MEFKVVEGIPLPVNSRGKPRKYNIPLENIKVGDHILIELPKTKIHQESKIIRNFVLRYKHKNPSDNFTVRKLDDGVGIWKI